MENYHFLIYIDILGFQNLANEISSHKGVDPTNIRREFIYTITRALENLEEKRLLKGKYYSGSDDWLLVVENWYDVFKCISEIIDHNTGYIGYETIPLEIAVGYEKYDHRSTLTDTSLIVENPTIKFLKTNIIKYFRTLYKQSFNHSPFKTFVAITCQAYSTLEPIDKLSCSRHSIDSIVPTTPDSSFYSMDIEVIKERGMLISFLESIGMPRSRWYGRIDKLFVYPNNYIRIQHMLHTNQILFLTGSPEYGKTYTAIRLMWECFARGLKAVWIKDVELSDLSPWDTLNIIEKAILPNTIIYLEDLFGKAKYRSNYLIERMLASILDMINKTENTYLVVTSREEVFKDFKSTQVSEIEIDKLTEQLNFGIPSYDYVGRCEMLIGYAEEKGCKWLSDYDSKAVILEALKNPANLPTPLSIKNFTLATAHIKDQDSLANHILLQSETVSMVFSREIREMPIDKLIFLCFVFIGYSNIKDSRHFYSEMTAEFEIVNAWEFDRALQWFLDDKIVIQDDYIVFSHESYRRAFEEVLLDDNSSDPVQIKILQLVLSKLSNNSKAIRAVSRTIAKYFPLLPEESQQILLQMSKSADKVRFVVWAIANHFNNLPPSLQNVLFSLSGDHDTDIVLVRAIADNFSALPSEAHNLLFASISNNELTAVVLRAIIDNYDTLPDVARKLLFSHWRDAHPIGHVIHAIAKRFEVHPTKAYFVS